MGPVSSSHEPPTTDRICFESRRTRIRPRKYPPQTAPVRPQSVSIGSQRQGRSWVRELVASTKFDTTQHERPHLAAENYIAV